MLRRDMLKGMAAVVALQPDFLFRVAANAAAASSRVRPGDAAWPSAASWARLNEAVGGNLIAAPAPFGGTLLAGALMRLRRGKSSAIPGDFRESSLHFSPSQSGGVPPYSAEASHD
jgi:hypothetical protein